MKLLLDDGNEHVCRQSAPDLRVHSILARAQESRDSQVLLDPLEEQLDLASIHEHGGNGRQQQDCVFSQNYQGLVTFWIFESNETQALGKVFGDLETFECNVLISDHPGRPIGWHLTHERRIHAPLAAGDEEQPAPMHLAVAGVNEGGNGSTRSSSV